MIKVLWRLPNVIIITSYNLNLLGSSEVLRSFLPFGITSVFVSCSYVFHVSLLRSYDYHPLYVALYPLDQIRYDLSFVGEFEAILDRHDRVMRNKTIPFVKILWKNHPEREAIWETEESMQASYPHFFSWFDTYPFNYSTLISRKKFFLLEGKN